MSVINNDRPIKKFINAIIKKPYPKIASLPNPSSTNEIAIITNNNDKINMEIIIIKYFFYYQRKNK